MKTNNPPPKCPECGAGQMNPDDLPFVTIQEVATRWRVSWKTIIRMIKAGQIRALRIGRIYRIPLAEVKKIEKS